MKKICIVTGSRADYGLYYPLLKRLKNDPEFRLQLIATGSHLSEEFGLTFKEIIRDGFNIDVKADINIMGKSAASTAHSAGVAVDALSKAYIKLKPDLVVLLGDRFEMLSAAFAAHLNGIPMAHIHGGELTTGSLDDAMRHAITKLSVLHFTATERYSQRVIQMGEHPSRVYTTGSLGVENIRTRKLLHKEDLQRALKINLKNPFAVVTLHPATNEQTSTSAQAKALFDALQTFEKLQVIITYPNADAGGLEIIKYIKSFEARFSNRCFVYKNLGTINYLSLLNYADAVIGNSSSGIIEAPAFGIPTVNIGERQSDRLAGKSVLNAMPEKEAVIRAIRKALSPAFKAICRSADNPYGNGNASKKIVAALKKYKNFNSIEKKFYDLT